MQSLRTFVKILCRHISTEYSKGKILRAWLKIDSIHIIAARDIEVLSDNELVVNIDIPVYLPSKVQTQSVDLIVDNDYEGYAILPDAIFISSSDKLRPSKPSSNRCVTSC